MKASTLFIAALMLALVKNGISLDVVYMDNLKTNIDVPCLGFGSSSSGILKSHKGLSYKTSWDKTLFLTTTSNCGIVVAIRKIDLRPNRLDNLTLSEFNSPFPLAVLSNKHYYQDRNYDPSERYSYSTTKTQLSVRFMTGSFDPIFWTEYQGFELIYTAYKKGTFCNRNEFNCRNGRCISSVFKCDGHNHCGNRWDQLDCYPDTPKRNIAAIVSGVVFLVIAVALVIFLIIRRASRSTIEATTVISHPPPSYPPPGTYYPPPPPAYTQYSQGQTNPGYH